MKIDNRITIAILIVQEAMEWLGTPYRHQGSKKGVGCDCLGLIRGIWKNVYGTEPENPGPYAADWAEMGGQETLLDAARKFCTPKSFDALAAGDLILFRWQSHSPAKHAAIMVDYEHFIHACEGRHVAMVSLVPQWKKRIAGVFSFPELHESLKG